MSRFTDENNSSDDARSVAAKEAARNQLAEDMKRFLEDGGEITSVEPNVMADPPRKPESNYGSRPI